MTPADIADLRAHACSVVAELGFALHFLAQLEGELTDPDPSPLLAEEAAGNACNHFEAAAAELADLVIEADALHQALRPRGEQPGDMPPEAPADPAAEAAYGDTIHDPRHP